MSPEQSKLLAEKVSKGDRQAYCVLFREYYGKVLRFVRSLVRDEAAAQDLAQEVFVKIWEKRRRLHGVVSLDSYLFVVSRNAALDYFKKAFLRKKLPMESVDEALMARISADISERIEAGSELEAVRKFILTMPERRRDIYIMSKFDGMDSDEIADALGISRKTVENQLYLAKSEIKRLS